MPDGQAGSVAKAQAPEPDAVDACLDAAKEEILRRCGVHVAGNDPVMAVLVAQDVFARRHASLVETAVTGATDHLAGQLDRYEAQMRERLDRHLANAARDGVGAVHDAALDQRAEFIAALRGLTERQERAAQVARKAQFSAVLGAVITLIIAALIAVGMLSMG